MILLQTQQHPDLHVLEFWITSGLTTANNKNQKHDLNYYKTDNVALVLSSPPPAPLPPHTHSPLYFRGLKAASERWGRKWKEMESP